MDPRNLAKPGRIRFRILALVFVNVVINYMDRSNISIAGAAIGKELALSSVELGFIFSAFGWTYTALQIPGGLMADRFGPRILYAFTLITWSAATLLQGFVKGFSALLGLRLATGAFEAPAFPTNNRIVTSWFPDNERASAIAMYTSGQFVGLAFLTPVLVALQHYLGWRGLFFITGGAGILWGVVWYLLYRDPLEHKKVGEAELAYIEKGGGIINRKDSSGKLKKETFSRQQFKQVFAYRKLWGIYIGQFAVNSTLWFFLTWFPTYLVQYRGFDFLKTGFFASLPFLAAFAGLLLSGFFSDYMVKRKAPLGLARKAPVILGLFLSISIIGANYVDSKSLIIFFMCLAFFGNGMASIAWVFVSTLAPKHLIGLTGGVFNFIGGSTSIIVPLVIGYLVKDGNFAPALLFIGMMALMGAFSYIFLVGKVERVTLPHEPRPEENTTDTFHN